MRIIVDSTNNNELSGYDDAEVLHVNSKLIDGVEGDCESSTQVRAEWLYTKMVDHDADMLIVDNEKVAYAAKTLGLDTLVLV